MKTFEPWQDTVNLIAGGKIRRTPRPGEHFEILERPPQQSRTKTWLRACLNRFRSKPEQSQDCHSKGETYAVPKTAL